MEQYAIKGGNPLVGEVEIGGAKNAALPILAASVMTDDTVYIDNVPDVRDTKVLLKAIEGIGAVVKHEGRHNFWANISTQRLRFPAVAISVAGRLTSISKAFALLAQR